MTDQSAAGQAPAAAGPGAVVFDLDGTLVLTEERNAEVWRSFLARYDLPLTPARFRQVTGRRGLDSLHELAAELPDRFGGRSPVELVEEVRQIDAATPFGQVQEVPGARALVRRLAEDRVPLALCTSATRPYALTCLQALDLTTAFAALVTAEDVRTGKPDPEGYRAACAAVGVDPGEAVAFEDSVAGIDAVLAAGLRCVGVATTQPREALSRADLVVDDLTQVGGPPWPLLTAPRRAPA